MQQDAGVQELQMLAHFKTPRGLGVGGGSNGTPQPQRPVACTYEPLRTTHPTSQPSILAG